MDFAILNGQFIKNILRSSKSKIMPIYNSYIFAIQSFKNCWFSTKWYLMFFVFEFSLLGLSACQSQEHTQVKQAGELPQTEVSKPSPKNSLPFTYRVRPSSLTEDKKAPLVIVLHGFGSNMDDLFALKDFVDSRYTFVSLQAPYSAGTNKFKWYDLIFSNDGNFTSNTEEAASSLQTLSDFVEDRYAGWKQEFGQSIMAGDHSLDSLSKLVLDNDVNPSQVSGRQELLENIVNRYV